MNEDSTFPAILEENQWNDDTPTSAFRSVVSLNQIFFDQQLDLLGEECQAI